MKNLTLCVFFYLLLPHHTTLITHHTSHITRHTSHITHHTFHTSLVAHHTLHTSYITSNITHTSHFTYIIYHHYNNTPHISHITLHIYVLLTSLLFCFFLIIIQAYIKDVEIIGSTQGGATENTLYTCEPGTYSLDAAVSCTPCPPGTYAKRSNSSTVTIYSLVPIWFMQILITHVYQTYVTSTYMYHSVYYAELANLIHTMVATHVSPVVQEQPAREEHHIVEQRGVDSSILKMAISMTYLE